MHTYLPTHGILWMCLQELYSINSNPFSHVVGLSISLSENGAGYEVHHSYSSECRFINMP